MAERTALERDLNEEEEEYDENADEDFNPDKAAADEDGSSSEEENETTVATAAIAEEAQKKRKAEADADLDSGDEATIREIRRKRRRKDKEKDAAAAGDDESGGEGGLVRTRAQRLAEKVERKERKKATGGAVTIDVEQVWAELKSVPVGRPRRPPPPAPKKTGDEAVDVDGGQDKENAPASSSDGMVTIKRRIEYAGETTEIEEIVPRTSKEAQLYLKHHPETHAQHASTTAAVLLRRPLKRPSLFEPNPTASIKGVPPERLRPRAPSRFDTLMAEKKAEEESRKKAERMTTVQKSALDWKGFVDQQEGMRAELDEYGKSKGGFLAREDFLGRADMAREEAARSARLKG